MKKLLNILKFELNVYFKNKAYVVTSIMLFLVVAVLLSFPRISALIKPNQDISKSTGTRVLANLGNSSELYLKALNDNTEGFSFDTSDASLDEAKKLVNDGKYEAVLFLNAANSFGFYSNSPTLYYRSEQINHALNQAFLSQKLKETGMNTQLADSIVKSSVNYTFEDISNIEFNNFAYCYALVFLLYMVVLIYGQMISTGVAKEKSTRTMEVLITSAKPKQLLFGKVIAGTLASLIQVGTLLFSCYIFFNLNKAYWVNNMVVSSLFNIPLNLLLYTILFFVLGFLLYAMLFGAIGSLVSKVEELNTAVSPLILLFVAMFMVVTMSMSQGKIDTTIMKIASFFPLSSPMAMFTRIAMGNVSNMEILISVVILVVSTYLFGALAARIYKAGVLMYGNKISIKNIFKALTARE